MEERKPILSAKDIEIEFSLRGKMLKPIRKCSLDLYEGETLAIVGESGSGKSVFTKSFIGMLDNNGSITGGSIMFEGVDIAQYKKETGVAYDSLSYNDARNNFTGEIKSYEDGIIMFLNSGVLMTGNDDYLWAENETSTRFTKNNIKAINNALSN